MQVKELIKDTVWIPGVAYSTTNKPVVSVILPTFRRNESGLFSSAVESVLEQTLEDLELIIVDDASTDGTANKIAEFMRRDGRISCLRHVKNIGLPAVSEYEAFIRSRADFLAFAFDDDTFYPDALEKLVKEAKKASWAVCYGYVEWISEDPVTGIKTTSKLGNNSSQGSLRAGNFIPNNGVLLPKKVALDIGFYDPHIVMARVCDWDLWRRIGERYELRFVDLAVAIVNGPSTADSLGKTYGLDSWAAEEWMRTARNADLRHPQFAEYDVLAVNPSHGRSTREVCAALGRKHAESRDWILNDSNKKDGNNQEKDGYVLVVNTRYDASTALCFDMLPQYFAQRVRVISINGMFGVEEMARATCVIFVRRLGAFHSWIDAALAMNVPIYYYLDDNLPLLTERGELERLSDEDFSLQAFRKALKRFSGALLTSEPLVKYFQDHLVHQNSLYFPPSCVNQTRFVDHEERRKNLDEIVIAFAGGTHRVKGLWTVVIPALVLLVENGTRIHLVTTESDETVENLKEIELPDSFRVTLLPFDAGYSFAMRRYARYSPDFVVHAPSDTENNRFKTKNVLLTASLLDAVAVLPATDPYLDIAQFGIAMIVSDPFLPVSWVHALQSLIEGKCDCSEMKRRNAQYCAQEFSGEASVAALGTMVRQHGGAPSWQEQERRLHKLVLWQRVNGALGGVGAAAATGGGNEGASELAALRKMRRYSWRHRILNRSSDLWRHCALEYEGLQRYSVAAGWRRRGASLELSDTLHDVAFHEYRVALTSGRLKSIAIAVAVDFVKYGLIGIELVAPDSKIVANISRDITKLELNKPVEFDFEDIPVTAGEVWKIRVFCHAKQPVYVYEFINRRLLGLLYASPTPFMKIVID